MEYFGIYLYVFVGKLSDIQDED